MPSLSAARVIRDCFKILAPSILRQKDSFYAVHYRPSAGGKAQIGCRGCIYGQGEAGKRPTVKRSNSSKLSC